MLQYQLKKKKVPSFTWQAAIYSEFAFASTQGSHQ